MSVGWVDRSIPLNFRLGTFRLFCVELRLKVADGCLQPDSRVNGNMNPADVPPGFDGYFIESLPVTSRLPRWTVLRDTIRYVPSQYERYFVDLEKSPQEYLAKFSSKSRSTLKRKIRRFTEFSGGEIKWNEYSTPSGITEFYSLARAVSEKTYQERLLGAGLPTTRAFQDKLVELASSGEVRGYILFHKQHPIAYLYTPVRNGRLLYQHLGYDPACSEYSPGTVLQWLVLEKLLNEQDFRLFDFTSGEGDHKRFFATGSQRCADVFILRRSLINLGLVIGHAGLNTLSSGLASMLGKLGLKASLKRLLRHGRATGRAARTKA